MKNILFFALAIAACITCRAQIITTIAGNGTGGFSGDGGAATAAQLFWQEGVAVDSSGNVYIADYNNNRIRMVSASGIITTIAGDSTFGFSGDGGAATAAQLQHPWGVAVDSRRNLYIADQANNRIRRVDTSGIITTYAGGGSAGLGDGGAATAAVLFEPVNVAVDHRGNVYIADESAHRIRKVNPSGIITTIAGNGTSGFSGDGGAATAAKLDWPAGVAVDGGGNIYIAEYGNSRIRKVDTSGIIITIAGNGTSGYAGDGGAATAAELYNPSRVAIDGGRNVYIADGLNNRIRRVDTFGIITTIAGNGTSGYSGDGGAATAAELHFTVGVAVDGSGNMFISDNANHRIRKVSCCPEDIKNIIELVKAITAFPNPAGDMLHIQSPVTIHHAVVYNLIGQRISETESGTNQLDLNIKHLPAGIYLLQVNDTWVQRFVKQ